MRRTLLPLMAIALFGAGCSPEPTVKPEPAAPTPPVSVPAPTPTPEPTPAPTSTSMESTALAFPGVLPDAEVNVNVRIKTTLGDIVIQVDKEQGPNAASNFVYLVKKGFYNGTIFHRVIPSFMIQGGDPQGTGRGGPGYQFPNDQVQSPYKTGIVAMANAGPDTNGSQFFIMVADYPLPPAYSVFGHVVTGQDVADKIAHVSRDSSDRPNTEVKMVSVTVE